MPPRANLMLPHADLMQTSCKHRAREIWERVEGRPWHFSDK